MSAASEDRLIVGAEDLEEREATLDELLAVFGAEGVAQMYDADTLTGAQVREFVDRVPTL